MSTYKVGIAQFIYRSITGFDAANYVTHLVAKLDKDPRISDVFLWHKNDTPITMTRNQCMVDMETAGVDYLVIIDDDMRPDLYVGQDPSAQPFWESSWAFMIDLEERKKHGVHHAGPCVVAAPYCGSPPDESVHAFRWVNHESHHPNPDFSLKTVTRHEAQQMRGIQLCAAAATGLMLIDMAGVRRLQHPRFYYEWKDETESQKASTEDVVFTRNLSYIGVPTYVNWNAWAGHVKLKTVGKPVPLTPAAINRQMRFAAREYARNGEFERVPSQEPPIRVRPVNTYSALPPTQDPALVTPTGLSAVHAGDQQAYEAWRELHEPLALDAAESGRIVPGLRDAVLDSIESLPGNGEDHATAEQPTCSP